MTPIAEKDFGIDAETGLQKKLQVWSIFCDADKEIIVIQFKIILLSPTGITVSILRNGSYTRTGSKFNQLRESQLGQGIEGLISSDLEMIDSFKTLDSDLKQNEI